MARHTRRLKADAAANMPLFDGAPEMLRRLSEAGIKLALVTSDSRASAERKLGVSVTMISYYDCAASLFGKPARFRCVIKRWDRQGENHRDRRRGPRHRSRAHGRHRLRSVAWSYAASQVLRAMQPDFMFERMGDIARDLLRSNTAVAASELYPKRSVG